MKTLKRIIVGALGVLGFVLACSDGYTCQDFIALVLMLGAIGLGLYWKPELDNEDNPII
jgi:hypothetical protein